MSDLVLCWLAVGSVARSLCTLLVLVLFRFALVNWGGLLYYLIKVVEGSSFSVMLHSEDVSSRSLEC